MGKHYKNKTLELTGMTEDQYKREYTRYAARVRNFNRATGSNVSASRAFYHSKKYADDLSPLQVAIQATPATRAHAQRAATDPYEKLTPAAFKELETFISEAWAGAIQKSETVGKDWKEYKEGKISLAEFERRANQWSKDRKEKIEHGDPTVGS